MIRFLYGWAAWDLTASAFWVGVVASLMLLPTFLLSPIFGITADRINPRNGLISTIGLSGVMAAVGGAISAMDAFTLPALLVMAVVFGAITSAHTPIRLAFVPQLVERAALPSAIGYSAMIFNTSRIIGPAVGAWLLVVTSLSMAFGVAAVLCITSSLLLLRVKGTEAKAERSDDSIVAQLLGGLEYLRSASDIKTIFVLTLTSGFLGRTAIELLPAISGRVLQGDSATLATLTAAAGAGSIVGGLVVSRQAGHPAKLFRLVVAALVFVSGVLLTTALWDSLTVAVAAIVLISLCTTMVGTGSQAITQLILAEEFRGRVMSLWSVIAMGTPAVAAMVLGALADAKGFALAFAASALPALLVIAWAWRRRLEP